jgi:methylmalonyl-CoA/ethylmalonyl-CoA epimerase
MIKKIHHVGVVVKNIEEALDLYVTTMGFKSSKIMTSREDGIKTVLVSLGEVTLELMEPIDPQGGVQKFLETRGEGIHHISLEVDNIEQERNWFESKNLQLIDKKPRYFEGALVSFVHPKSTRGVLIELLQWV